jgi:hypothetical protein
MGSALVDRFADEVQWHGLFRISDARKSAGRDSSNALCGVPPNA